MKLIICEKPSLAKNVCKALSMGGEHFNRDSAAQVGTKYVVIPAFGHLFGLANPDQYKGFEGMKKWEYDTLPFFPERFQFVIKDDAGVKKQYGEIKKWIHDSSITEIIHCGDSDREGEVIVRLILDNAKNDKPVKRLWIPDQVESTILQGLKDMKDDTYYDNLANEGLARTYVDWLYGINLTRYASVKNGAILHIGRVLSAIVRTVYDRDMEIKNFVPQKYLMAESVTDSNGCNIKLSCKEKYALSDMSAVKDRCDKLNSVGAKVTDKKTERKKLAAPKLFSQSALQNTLSKRYQFSADKTLSLVQSLYEAGFVSYPRTPTEYMATAEKSKVQQILKSIGDKVTFKDNKNIFDNSKIESHSAITPTIKLPKDSDFKNADEKHCYQTIFNRFCAVFCKEDCLIDQTVMVIKVGDEDFTLKGNVDVQPGFKAFEPVTENKEDKLPNLNIGDDVTVDFKPCEKETKPPKHYSVSTMNNFLKNPFKKEKDDDLDTSEPLSDDEDYKNILAGLEIGTEATRSGIIKNAIDLKYIALEKTNYVILPTGIRLIEVMDKLHIDMDKYKTANMGKDLKDVYKGTKTTPQLISSAEKEIADVIKLNPEMEKQPGAGKTVLGKCPKCGGDVVSGKFGAYCSKKCGMTVSMVRGKSITDAQVKSLLAGKKILIKGLTAKSGKKYDAYFAPTGLEDFSYISKKDGKEIKGTQFKFDMSFPERKGK